MQGRSADGTASNSGAALTARPSLGKAEQHFRVMEVELDRTKRHLAEVIDEVVFAEKCKTEAEDKLQAHLKEAAGIENILQDMIGYLIAIENAVIVPAIDEITEALPSGTVAERAQLFSDMERLQHVSPRTIRLIASMKNPSQGNRDRFRKRRDQLLRQHERSAINLDDAYALTALLIDAKEELQLLLADGRDRALKGPYVGSLELAASRTGLNNSSGPTVATTLMQQQLQQVNEATQQMAEGLQRQVEAVRFELEASNKEKEMLNKRLNEIAVSHSMPYEQLQQQHYQEKERLQLQVRSLQEGEKNAAERNQYLTGKLEVMQETIQQLQEEKKLLQGEIKGYRRNEANLADGQQLASLQMQCKQHADDSQRLRIELDTMIREHSTTVTRLEAQNSHLRLELAEAKQQARPANHEHYAQLQRTNDLLRKDLVVLQQKLLSSTGRVTDNTTNFDAKVQAFEMTISSLTNELELLQRRINSQEHAFAQERAALITEMDRERIKYQRDKEDYDTLMQKMVDEMDQIVAENKVLKERIMAVTR